MELPQVVAAGRDAGCGGGGSLEGAGDIHLGEAPKLEGVRRRLPELILERHEEHGEEEADRGVPPSVAEDG